ncbi:MAG: TrmH family RNA methyltransferase, partial [Gemmatimonadota bacterium]
EPEAEAVLRSDSPEPVVLLQRPTHLGNLGAAVRAAAAAEAAGLLATGEHDPWHASALRGAAGLHYALPVTSLAALRDDWCDRPLVAVDPDGAPLDRAGVPDRAVLAFGRPRWEWSRRRISWRRKMPTATTARSWPSGRSATA